MKTVLLWDAHSTTPTRFTVEDTVASALVRSGVAAAADPLEAGALTMGVALDGGAPTEIVLQHGTGRQTTVRVTVPLSVATIAIAAGVAAAVGTPIVTAPLPALSATPTTKSITANAASGTLLFAIGNVPAGVTPTVSPNDGRFAIAGDATNGWKVVTGLSALSAGSVNVSANAAGATSVVVPVTITAVAGPSIYIGQVANNTRIPNLIVPVNGSNNQWNSRTMHVMTDNVSRFKVVVPNWDSEPNVAERNVAVSQTYSAAVEYPAGTFTRITWNGSATGTTATTDDQIVSDWVNLPIPLGGECHDFRVWAGMMGKKESHYASTQRACDPHRASRPAAGRQRRRCCI